MKSLYSEVFNRHMIEQYQHENPNSRLNDAVYDCISDAINSVRLNPGNRLNITEIARALDVSVTPTKTAVQRLAHEGLIEERNPGSYYVFDVTEKMLVDIFNMRRCQEGFAAYLCAERLALIELEKLEKLAMEYKKYWLAYADGDNSRENYQARLKADVAFHELVVTFADNALLCTYYRQAQQKANYTLHRTFGYWEQEKETAYRRQLAEQHMIIVNAIATGIPDIARKAAEDHVQFAANRCVLNRKI